MNNIRTSFLFTLFLLVFTQLQATDITLNPQSGVLKDGSNEHFTNTKDSSTKKCGSPQDVNGYTFYGWFDAPIGGNRVYDTFGDPVISIYWDSANNWIFTGEALTLYAHWQQTSLSFDPQGGSKAPNSVSVLATSQNSSTKTSPGTGGSRKGYTFGGWYSAPQGGTMVYDQEGKAFEGDCWKKDGSSWYWQSGDYQLKLYAQWQANVHANEDPDHSGVYYSTFYDDTAAYEIPEGVTAYTASLNGNTLSLNAISGNILPKGTGVILKAAQDEIDLIPIADTSEPAPNNLLTGTTGDSEEAQQNGYVYYKLSYGQNKLGFYLVGDNDSLVAHKAYVRMAKGASSTALSCLRFVEDETGLHAVAALDSIPTVTASYDLSGRVMTTPPEAGFGIVNGKKTIRR